MQTVIETKTYLSSAKAAGVSEVERAEIVSAIASKPQAGEVIVGSGGHGRSGSLPATRQERRLPHHHLLRRRRRACVPIGHLQQGAASQFVGRRDQ
jgi:hypothetical protein